jgi:hypothetical protein
VVQQFAGYTGLWKIGFVRELRVFPFARRLDFQIFRISKSIEKRLHPVKSVQTVFGFVFAAIVDYEKRDECRSESK